MVNRENLKILSDGLLGLTKPIVSTENVKFDMSEYCDMNSDHTISCGTAGCAIGWGPFFGIKKYMAESFFQYQQRCFTKDESGSIFDYLFSGHWHYVDNTKRGAGLRIKYYLEHGLPEDWKEQMLGQVLLTYLNNNDDE